MSALPVDKDSSENVANLLDRTFCTYKVNLIAAAGRACPLKLFTSASIYIIQLVINMIATTPHTAWISSVRARRSAMGIRLVSRPGVICRQIDAARTAVPRAHLKHAGMAFGRPINTALGPDQN